MAKTKVGIIGCGNISDTYFKGCPAFEVLQITACADVDMARAHAQAAKYGLRALSVDELLADAEIDLVINLTVPMAHAEINVRALEAGKNVHTEKPLAVTRADGQRTLELAARKQLRVGSAPDTFMGGGLQTCLGLINAGAIGEPVAASAFMVGRGPEAWHPSPDSFYQTGAGPMFDVGPYYLTSLLCLLGPVRRVTASARASFAERTAGHPDVLGRKIRVDTPTHIAGVLEFRSGLICTLITSFDIWHSQLPRIEIYGSTGTLSVPDPNTFGGPVLLRNAEDANWREMPLTHGYTENSRGIGAADMVHALRSGRPHRASGALAYHVLDLMHAFHDAARAGTHVELASTCQQPAPLPRGLQPGTLD